MNERIDPADNEREAIIDALLDELGWEWDEVPEEHIPSSKAILGDMADRVLAVSAGFRRTEVPDPHGRGMVCSACGVPFHLIQHDEGCDIRKPQGEPSDVQVNREYLAQVIHKAVYSRIPLDRLTTDAQADAYKRADAVLAALRAAGGVR